MIKTKTSHGESELSPLEAHKEAVIDAKLNHLSIKLLKDYAFNKDALTQADISKIEDHINITSCESCTFNLSTLQKNNL